LEPTDLLGDYLGRFEDTWGPASPVGNVRFVVLDSETTGLDPRKDRLVTIGAVAVRGGEIWIEDSFEALLKVAYNTSAVTVHGVTRDETSEASDEPEALRLFLSYLRDGVIVGHHPARRRNAGRRLRAPLRLPAANRSLDTMDLTLHLREDGAFAGGSRSGLLARRAVQPLRRRARPRTAPGDAFSARSSATAATGRPARTRPSRGLAEPFPVEENAAGAVG
jgi:DNA polymerase-3 subunit epsilon